MNEVYFDLETQYTFGEIGMNNYRDRDPKKLKIAVAGTLSKNNHTFFEENQVEKLIEILNDADLIVGHNLFGFDYIVIQPYIDKGIIENLYPKTFDTMLELNKITGCYTSLDDLCKRNLGISKNEDSIKIPGMWRNGEFDRVKKYLLNDLRMTEALYNHGKNKKKIKYEHKEYGESYGEREIIVNW